MNMREKKFNQSYNADQAPIDIPPVEDAWLLMKQKLDVGMPVRPWWHVHGLGIATGVFISASIIFWLGSHRIHSRQVNEMRNVSVQTEDSIMRKKIDQQKNTKTRICKQSVARRVDRK